jgi:DNA-binding helix-hairpin-helix protein with protein kinase domain
VPWILPPGATLAFEGAGAPVRVLRGIGGGTQGQVYEVELEGERLALKWYLPACIARDPGLPRRLGASIRATAPSEDFLWPLALLRPTPASRPLLRSREPGFGYLMDLRPADFVGAHEHVAGLLEISLRSVLRACFFLADAFHALHLRGFCYRDVSLGNLFLEAASGRILICDNDNVDVDGQDPGGVLGTPGFMAPEVLLGRARPGTTSDLFSLAVLLFRLLTRHDPLRGEMELAIHCLDEPARRRLYGEDPVFIFDPIDTRNRPDPIEHVAALITWPIYPRPLQALFEQTFCRGLRDPRQRALTGQWRRVLAACLDRRQICAACGQETFPDPDAPPGTASCWSCGVPLAAPLRLRLPHALVTAAPGNEIHAHHFDPREPESLRRPLARVEAHPGEASRLGLRNLSERSWDVTLAGGERMALEPGRACNLAAVAGIATPAGPIVRLR